MSSQSMDATPMGAATVADRAAGKQVDGPGDVAAGGRPQVDPLAPSHCIYGQAGERVCGYTGHFRPAWCCHHGEGMPVADTGMST